MGNYNLKYLKTLRVIKIKLGLLVQSPDIKTALNFNHMGIPRTFTRFEKGIVEAESQHLGYPFI